MWDMCPLVGSSWGCLGLAQPGRPTNTTPSRRSPVGGSWVAGQALRCRPNTATSRLGSVGPADQTRAGDMFSPGLGWPHLGAGPGSPAPTVQTRPKSLEALEATAAARPGQRKKAKKKLKANHKTKGTTNFMWVIYVYAIKKVASYVYAMKKFTSTCMPRTRSSLTYMPFWMDGELTEVLEGL
jgi:hypothetical protein